MEKLIEEEKRVINVYANILSLNLRVCNYTSFPSLGYERLVRVIAKSLNLSTEETKKLLDSAIEKNPLESVR
jgi:hypothetical protein